MPMFRKRPVVVEAIQYTGFNTQEVLEFGGFPSHSQIRRGLGSEIKVFTLEGEMTARPTDWIIRGVKGECYPCKQDIFEMTYEPAE